MYPYELLRFPLQQKDRKEASAVNASLPAAGIQNGASTPQPVTTDFSALPVKGV